MTARDQFCKAARTQWPENTPYRNRSLFFAVSIHKGHVQHSPIHQQVWQNRARNLLMLMAALAPALPDTSFLAYLHDGCPSQAQMRMHTPPNHFAIGVTETCKQNNAWPLPFVPQQHNPLFNKPIMENPLAVHVELAKKYPQNAQVNKCVWRGKLTDHSRGNSSSVFQTTKHGNRARACLLTLMYPDIIDARAVETSSFLPENVAAARHRMPFETFFYYKYALDINGAGCSFRMASLLMGNSVVIAPKKYTYFFTDTFKEAIVHINEDLSDLVSTIRRLEQNQSTVNTLASQKTRAIREGAFTKQYFIKKFVSVLHHFPYLNVSFSNTPCTTPPP